MRYVANYHAAMRVLDECSNSAVWLSFLLERESQHKVTLSAILEQPLKIVAQYYLHLEVSFQFTHCHFQTNLNSLFCSYKLCWRNCWDIHLWIIQITRTWVYVTVELESTLEHTRVWEEHRQRRRANWPGSFQWKTSLTLSLTLSLRELTASRSLLRESLNSVHLKLLKVTLVQKTKQVNLFIYIPKQLINFLLNFLQTLEGCCFNSVNNQSVHSTIDTFG